MVKRYKEFITKIFKSEYIRKKCKEYNITNYTINSDGSIDVDGNVDIYNKNLKKLPLKFRNVSGDFYCPNNNLTSLEGAPTYVGASFDCEHNNLTSLQGAPTHVIGYFDCSDNDITSLEGSPTQIGGSFLCNNNNLTSLEGGPTHVGGNFHCDNNEITGLEGFPTNLHYFYCNDNPVYEIWILFKDSSKIELFNYYDIVRGTDISIDRLNDFLITIGKKPVGFVYGYNNI